MLSTVFFLVTFFTLGNCYPSTWIKYDNMDYNQDQDYVQPAQFGEILPQRRSSSPQLISPPILSNQYQHFEPQSYHDNAQPVDASSRMLRIGDFLSQGLYSGFKIFDKAVPQIGPRDVSKLQEAENFTRSRRHEETTKTTLLESNFETLDMKSPNERYEIGDVENVTTLAVIEKKMGESENELERIIQQLNTALDYIKKHNHERATPVNANSTTEELVKHISSTVDVLMKTKNNETRALKVKDISFALDILLNRIAKSANDVIKNRPPSNTTKTPLKNDDLMLRIVKYATEARKEALAQKLQAGGELSSQEIDGTTQALINKLRQARQEDDSTNNIDGDVNNDAEEVTEKAPEITTTRMLEVTAKQEESDSSSSEEGGNLVANLLSSFLGSLSTPEGGVDVDAIVGLVSGLSVQRDDGTFDFSGLTELLQSFLGGDEEGEGGSDVGAFLGGLLGAILQGSANPPGAKGAGKLTGNLIANILPGLSGPAPPASGEEAPMGQKPIDSGSFLAGILTSMLGASSGASSSSKQPAPAPTNGNGNHKGGSAEGSASFFIMIKNSIFKSIFSIITSLLTSSSGASSSSSSKGHH